MDSFPRRRIQIVAFVDDCWILKRSKRFKISRSLIYFYFSYTIWFRGVDTFRSRPFRFFLEQFRILPEDNIIIVLDTSKHFYVDSSFNVDLLPCCLKSSVIILTIQAVDYRRWFDFDRRYLGRFLNFCA